MNRLWNETCVFDLNLAFITEKAWGFCFLESPSYFAQKSSRLFSTANQLHNKAHPSAPPLTALKLSSPIIFVCSPHPFPIFVLPFLKLKKFLYRRGSAQAHHAV